MALQLNNIHAVLLIFMLGKIKEVEGLPAEPVQVHIFLGYNVQKEYLVGTVLQNLPNGSTMSGQVNLQRHTFSSASMDNETLKHFSPYQYKEMAEIVVIFVDTSTKLDSVPKFSGKKKTFVVVFGSSVPETWKNVATDENHLFLVTSDSNSSMIIEHIMRQLNSDSRYFCDIDMYSTKKGYKCKACSNLCGTDPKQRSKTCSLRCPYFWPKISTPTPAVWDEKITVVIVVASVVIGVLVIVGFILVVYFIKKKKLPTPSSSEGTFPEARELRTIQLTDAHQETEIGREDDQSQTSQRLLGGHTMTNSGDCSSSEGDGGAGPSMPDLEYIPHSVSK